MKSIPFLSGCLLFALISGCTTVKDTEVGRTPVGSVVSGETTDPADYIERVRQRNEGEVSRAGENPTFQPGSHRDAFQSSSPFPVRD